MKIELLYAKLASPARRALQTLKIAEVESLSGYTKKMISELHGIGPNALKVMEGEMASLHISFLNDESDTSSIDEYMAGFPAPIQEKLKELRSLVKSVAPEATEKMAYGMPSFGFNHEYQYEYVIVMQ